MEYAFTLQAEDDRRISSIRNMIATRPFDPDEEDDYWDEDDCEDIRELLDFMF